MVKLVKVKIYGKVQGVFFRESARYEAKQLGINGLVRNERGGSLYFEAEGDEEHLKKFIDWCRKGPEMALVQKIDIEYLDELKFYKTFELE
ncbi:MAG: acylphosphatase [Patescibacteria group bacterium]